MFIAKQDEYKEAVDKIEEEKVVLEKLHKV